jgi:hypothetical protein
MIVSRPATRLQWRRIIESHRASGRSVSGYCREHGISPAGFYAWRRRLQGAEPTAAFVEVKTVEDARPACADGIEVCLAGGHRVLVRRGFDRDLLIETIGVLEGLS